MPNVNCYDRSDHACHARTSTRRCGGCAGRRYALQQPLVGWRQCAKNMHNPNGLIHTRIGKPACTCLKCRCRPRRYFERSFFGIVKEATNVEKTQSKEYRKIVFLQANENVPPRFKQYQIQGNASNLVQSHFGSPASKVLESEIAPLVPLGFYPACWGLNQPSPSRGEGKPSLLHPERDSCV